MTVRGGGHALPHPTAPFPQEIVGRTNRDLDGAREIWAFFARHLYATPTSGPVRGEPPEGER